MARASVYDVSGATSPSNSGMQGHTSDSKCSRSAGVSS